MDTGPSWVFNWVVGSHVELYGWPPPFSRFYTKVHTFYPKLYVRHTGTKQKLHNNTCYRYCMTDNNAVIYWYSLVVEVMHCG